MIDRFHWVVPGRLAAMSLPGRVASLEEDLSEIRDQGIDAVATLTEYPLDAEALEQAGLLSRHFPIEDFGVPRIEQVADFCRWVDERHREGLAVAVHCFAGLGRTGLMIACWLARERGRKVDEILTSIRRIEPGFVQTAQQEAFISVWQAGLVR